MYLKSLEMVGFKSFAEARLEFPNGVTAIVGPNGSGKSNVVDAILGTRRTEYEDVAQRKDGRRHLQRNELRKPLGMAEVSLVISGLDQVKVEGQNGRRASCRNTRPMITRRSLWNGDSEYLINKTQCRLKDIRSTLLDTGQGRRGTPLAQRADRPDSQCLAAGPTRTDRRNRRDRPLQETEGGGTTKIGRHSAEPAARSGHHRRSQKAIELA